MCGIELDDKVMMKRKMEKNNYHQLVTRKEEAGEIQII